MSSENKPVLPRLDLLIKEDRKIVEMINLICIKCKNLCNDPVIISCDHETRTSCKCCSIDIKLCDVCTTPNVYTTGEVTLVRNLLKKLRFHCVNHVVDSNDSCNVIVPYDEFTNHCEVCKFNGIKCVCDETVPAGRMKSHKENSCVLRRLEYLVDPVNPDKLLIDAKKLVDFVKEIQINSSSESDSEFNDAFFDNFITTISKYIDVQKTVSQHDNMYLKHMFQTVSIKYIKLAKFISDIDEQRSKLVTYMAKLQQMYQTNITSMPEPLDIPSEEEEEEEDEEVN